MTPLADRVCAWLAPRRAEMEAFLQHLVNIDSNSHDKAGTNSVADAMAAMLTADDIATSRIPNPTYGDVLRADLPGTRDGAPVLLMGHRDTVFAKGTVATRANRSTSS